LARNLRKNIEIENDKRRESKNFDIRRRALNMDKLEEMYDQIVHAKRHNKKSDVFNKVDIQNTCSYFRVENAVKVLENALTGEEKEELEEECD